MSLSPSDNYTGASYLGNVKENWLLQLYNQNSYLSFDGSNDYINLGSTSGSSPLSFTSTTKMSACGWVKFPTLGSTEYIFANNSIINWAGVVILKDSSNRLSILWGNTSGTNNMNYELMKTDGTFGADTWTFFAITTDFSLTASDTKIWLGTGSTLTAQTVSNSGTAGITTPTYTSGNAYIGRYFSTYSELDIKNLGFWTGELDSDSVTALFNSGDFLSFEEDSGNYDQSSNLKGYFEFNNGENFAQDIAGNVATGTITGAKYKGFLPLALRDTTVDDVFYHGVIKSNPSIRHNIDVIKSKSKTGNISVSLINAKYQGDDLSAELFLGSNSYYNRNVKVYSQLSELNTIDDCLQLYHGRLTNISHSDSNIKLSLVEKSPWDDKFLPVDKSNRGTFHPIVYGAFTTNDSTYAAPRYLENSTYFNHHVFPVKVDYVNYNFHCIGHKAVTSTDATLHFYESAVDEFIPLHDVNNSASTGYISSSGQDFTTKYTLQRSFQFKPKTSIGSHDWTNASNMVEPTTADDDSVSFATTSLGTVATASASQTHEEDIVFTLPSFSDFAATTGDTHGFTVSVRSEATGFYSTTNQTAGLNTHYYALYDYTSGSYVQLGSNSVASPDADNLSDAVTLTISTKSADLKTTYNADGYADGFKLRWRRYVQTDTDEGGSPNVRGYGTLKVYDVRFKVTLALAIANNTEWKSKISGVKELYSGADGFTASWDDGAITLGHDAHRDMLIRYAGMPTIEPENWTTLENDRSAWTIRYWINKEISLKKALEKLQYEFGFIHKIDPSGKSKYIWIHGTDSDNVFRSQDVDVTLNKNDISSLNISTSPVNQIMTKAIINTEKHPAKNDYITTTTTTNATPRATYNIKSKENTTTINLDALTLAPATDPSSVANKQADFSSYYSQVSGDVKKIVECEIVNTQKGYLLETGDIVKFENMPVDPFARTWDNYYMVTDLSRSVGKIKIKVREVG